MNANEINILIVEDEEPERLSLKVVLEAGGYSVSEADNAAVAMDMIRQQFFDILIVDYRLPDINGIDLIKQALDVSKESVPIVVTGFSSLEVAVESMRIGAHDYIVKPINVDELKKYIESILLERRDLQSGKLKLAEALKSLEIPDDSAVVLVRRQNEIKKSSPVENVLNVIISAYMQLRKYFWDID